MHVKIVVVFAFILHIYLIYLLYLEREREREREQKIIRNILTFFSQVNFFTLGVFSRKKEGLLFFRKIHYR